MGSLEAPDDGFFSDVEVVFFEGVVVVDHVADQLVDGLVVVELVCLGLELLGGHELRQRLIIQIHWHESPAAFLHC